MRHSALLLVWLTVTVSLAHAADERHPLTKALDYDTNTLLLIDLDPSARQLTELKAAAQSAGAALAGQDSATANALQSAGDLLSQEYLALTQGTPVSEELATRLAELRRAAAERRDNQFSTVDAAIRRVRRSLSPRQASLVNWNLPADVPVTHRNSDGTLDELRSLAARLTQAERFLERLRYVTLSEYKRFRMERTEEFLQAYLRPGTIEFDEAKDWVAQLLSDMRLVKEDAWPQEEALYAAQLLQRLGALETPGLNAGQGRTKYNWWDIYYLLTDPQTPGMLAAYVGATADGAANPPPQDNQNGQDAQQ